MTHVTSHRVGESTTTTGTGPVTLAGALTAHRTFASQCSVGQTVYYDIEAVDDTGLPTGAFEAGLGTYSGTNELTRTTPQYSSNGDAAVDFAAGTKYVRLVASVTQLTDSRTPTAHKASHATGQSDAIAPSDIGAQPHSSALDNVSGVNTGDQDLSGKQATLVSGTNIKTVNSASVLGSGDLVVSGMNLGANTFTDTQTITQGTANKGIVASTGYSLTGSNATSMVDLAGTLNTSGNPVLFKMAATVTAAGATTKFASWLGGSGGTTEMFYVDKNGKAFFASEVGAFSQGFQIYGDQNNVRVGSVGSSAALRINASTYVEIGIGSNRFVGFGGAASDTAPTTGASLVFSATPGLRLGRAIADGGAPASGYWTIDFQDHSDEKLAAGVKLVGQNAYASAATLLTGGNMAIVAGAGASGSSGAAHGGSISLDGGQAYGTGVIGDIYIGNTRGKLQVKQEAIFSKTLQLASYTVGTLPSASTSGVGALAMATDLVSLVNGTTATTGGSLKGVCKSDGSAWIVLG